MPTPTPHTDPAFLAHFLGDVAMRVATRGVFGEVRPMPGVLVCDARGAAAPASYRLLADRGRLHVALMTPDRWLSHSIEADLLNTGDKLEDLVEEELVEQGWSGVTLPVEHFRGEDKQFVFRSPLPILTNAPDAAEKAAIALLAYEACFRRLGDMDAETKF